MEKQLDFENKEELLEFFANYLIEEDDINKIEDLIKKIQEIDFEKYKIEIIQNEKTKDFKIKTIKKK